MKILLVQNASYLRTYGGANKANRLLIEAMAAIGQECRVVAPAVADRSPKSKKEFLNELAVRGVGYTYVAPEKVVFHHEGVEVHAVLDESKLRAHVVDQICEFNPTWVLMSSEDPGQVLLEAALEASPSRVVYLAHTVMFLPFGPH